MTRVLYVGNVSENHVPKTPGFSPEHSTENQVKIALRNLGHECLPLLEAGLDWSTLPGIVNQTQPDLLLWTRTAGFDPGDRQEQGRIIKGLGVPTVGFHLDRWWGLTRETKPEEHGPRAPDPSPFFWLDFLFTADGGNDDKWAEIGANHYWSPPGILSDEANRVGVFREEYASPVGFVGNLRRYAHPEWGPYRHSLYRFLSLTYRGRFKLWEGGIRGQDLADLYASVKVLIGDSCLAGNPVRYWSDRIPETLGRGGYLIHPYVVGLAIAHPNLHMYDLSDFDSLRRGVDLALSDDQYRVEVNDQNRTHVLANHTYEHRLERLLSIVLS